jgi:hypothetical protein
MPAIPACHVASNFGLQALAWMIFVLPMMADFLATSPD